MNKKAKDKSIVEPATAEQQTILPLDKLIPDPSAVLVAVTPTISELVDECLFVLDTNALLAPYKIGAGSYTDIERIARRLVEANRLFIPDQVLREYLITRDGRIRDAFEHVHNAASNLAKKELAPLQLPMLEERREFGELTDQLNVARQVIRECRNGINAVKNLLKDWSWDDPISKLYGELFAGKVLIKQSLSVEELRREADWRKAYNIPPGYKDSTKSYNELGDLIIWHCILELGRHESKNVAFVTNEEKADWWIRSQEEMLLPRQELCYEFQRETKRHFGMMSFSSFLQRMGAKEATVERAERQSVINGGHQMKRDMELVRKILFALEEGEHGFVRGVRIDGYTDEQVGYHAYLMKEAGLIRAADTTHLGSSSPEAQPSGLTSAGHDFVDAARSDTIWNKALTKIKEAGGSVTLSTLTGLLKRLVDEQLGL